MDEATLEMLAYDIADLLDRNDYGLDVGSSDILPALPEFIARITHQPQEG
jgi:hypothetical protein